MCKSFTKSYLIGLLSPTFLLAACQTVPITGRKRLILIPESTEFELGATTYNDILQKSRLSTDAELATVMGHEIAHAIARHEADHMGLIFMAKAGYDPHAAIDFWKKMQEEFAGQEPPEFLSTHPSSKRRISNLKRWLPEALRYYHK